MSLYRNPNLAQRLSEVSTIDRWTRHVVGTIEHVLSLSIATERNQGMVIIALSLDDVADGVTLASAVLAVYPMSAQADAEADARLVGLKYDLGVRKAHSGVGWVHLADAPQDIHSGPIDFKV